MTPQQPSLQPTPLYLGIDLGTQSLKAILLQDANSNDGNPKQHDDDAIHLTPYLPEPIKIKYQDLIRKYFPSSDDTNDNLKRFGSEKDGIRKSPDHKIVETDPMLLILALQDLLQQLNEKLARDNDNSSSTTTIVSVAACAQQHGSIYWRKSPSSSSETTTTNAQELFHEIHQLQSAKDFAEWIKSEQFKEKYFLCDAPIWMDSSTQRECQEIEAYVNQHDNNRNLAEITGSRAYERFTASQIRKRRHLLSQCEAICLISSLPAWWLCGRMGPIDLGDGSGMNLLDMKTRKWSKVCMEAVLQSHGEAPTTEWNDLKNFLHGDPVSSVTQVGTIHNIIQKKYPSLFSKNCSIIVGTGDNVSSSYSLAKPGDLCISLGSSHTAFGFSKEYKRGAQLEGHVFLSPWASRTPGLSLLGDNLPLICIKNGGMCREKMCKAVCNNNWEKFNDIVSKTPPSKDYIGFYFFDPEIVPKTETNLVALFEKTPQHGWIRISSKKESEWDEKDVKALIDSQCMQLLSHCETLGLNKVNRIIVIGGASGNEAICQTLANSFGVSVYNHTATSELAAYGSAVRAYLAKCGGEKGNSSQQQTADYPNATLLQRVLAGMELELVCEADEEQHVEYQNMLKEYQELEKVVVGGGGGEK